jgi:hypothetical protein
MDLDLLTSIPSEIFAGAIAWFLIRWLTGQIAGQLREIKAATTAQTLTNIEHYKFALIHDAQSRGVHEPGEEDVSAVHRLAFEEYQKINDSLSNLKDQISKL